MPVQTTWDNFRTNLESIHGTVHISVGDTFFMSQRKFNKKNGKSVFQIAATAEADQYPNFFGLASNCDLHAAEQRYIFLPPTSDTFFAVLSSTIMLQTGSLNMPVITRNHR